MDISDIQFFRFVNNLLSKPEMDYTRDSLVEQGEADATLQASMAVYAANTELADEMLGSSAADTQLEKNLHDNDRMPLAAHSEEANNETTTFMKTNINLSKEELQTVHNLVSKFNESYNNGETLGQNLVKFYISQRPGTFAEDAADTVAGLRKGIDSFNSRLREALADGNFDYAAELDRLTSDVEMTLRDKFELYANFLASVKTLDAADVSADDASLLHDFRTLRSSLRVEGDVTEEMLDDLKSRIARQLESSTLCLGSVDNLRQLIGVLPDGEEATEKAVNDDVADMREKLVAAVATCAAYENGQLGSLEGMRLSPEVIGIAAAAGVEQGHIIDDLNSGRTTVDIAIRVLKIVGGVALFSILAYCAVIALTSIATAVAALLYSLLGVSAVATIASFGIMACVMLPLADTAVETGEAIMNWSSRTFDLVVDYWRKMVCPAVSRMCVAAYQWLRNLVTGGVLTEQGQTGENTVQTTLNN